MKQALVLLSICVALTLADVNPRNVFTIVAHQSAPDFATVRSELNAVLGQLGLRGTVLTNLHHRDSGCLRIQPDYWQMLTGMRAAVIPCTDDATDFSSVRTLVDILEESSVSWNAFFEGYPAASAAQSGGSLSCTVQFANSQCCDNSQAGGDTGAAQCVSTGGCFLDSICTDGAVCASTAATFGDSVYSRLRNPFVSFPSITQTASRCQRILPATSIDFNNLAQWVFYVPSTPHSLAPAFASWLADSSAVFQQLLAGGYNGVINIVFDNAEPNSDAVFAVVIDTANQVYAPHRLLDFETEDATSYTHSSFLRATEINFGIGRVDEDGDGEGNFDDDHSAEAVGALALRDGCVMLDSEGVCTACADPNALTAREAGVHSLLLNFCVCKPFFFDLDDGTAANQMHCLAPAGVVCVADGDCSSGVCRGGSDQIKPRTCQVVGAGDYCLFDDDCVSYDCDDESETPSFTCRASPEHGMCVVDSDCGAGLFCFDANPYVRPEHAKTFDQTEDFLPFTCEVNACSVHPNGNCGAVSEATCEPTKPGVRTCHCEPNFVTLSGGESELQQGYPPCVGNPCALQPDFCGPHAHCSPSIVAGVVPGTATVDAVCTCNAGFVSFRGGNGATCVRNGCLLFPACDDHADCTPNPEPGLRQGAALCKCREGYEGSGYITKGGCARKPKPTAPKDEDSRKHHNHHED